MTRRFEKMIVKYPTARDIIKNYTLMRAGSFTKEAIEQAFSFKVAMIYADGSIDTNISWAGNGRFETDTTGIETAKKILGPKWKN